MKNYLLIVCFLFINCFSIKAQKGLDEMIAAEKAFAAYSVANNTKDAFLKFMDTSAIMFKDGEPYKSFDVWLKREKRAGVLNWWPRYAEISGSGDFGYTCGPWTFQPKTITDSVVASGYFFTIWKKNSAGEWKFILDVGIDAAPITNEADVMKITSEKTGGTEHSYSLTQAEEVFLNLYRLDEAKAYENFLSVNAIIGKNNSYLNISNWKQMQYGQQSKKIAFVFQRGGIAPSGDLGYAYGSAQLNGKKETYLRIWRHEPAGWKIALQLIRL